MKATSKTLSTVLAVVLQGWCSLSRGDESRLGESDTERESSWTFKFTPSYYATTNQADASDLNLRGNYGAHAVWLGYYRRGSEFEQVRAGYEYTAQMPFGKLVPSVFLATHNVAGVAVNAEIGSDVYGMLGMGRTNLGDYYNLNFDPNDSVLFGFGTRLLPRSNLALFRVQDDRLHTGQRVTHLAWRFQADEHQRWTVDLSGKHGRLTADDDAVSGNAFSVTYDYKNLFVRIARDDKVNFTPDDMARLAVGFRF